MRGALNQQNSVKCPLKHVKNAKWISDGKTKKPYANVNLR